MIVVLILTSIVIGMAFAVLTLVQKQMLGVQSNFQATTELRLLEQSLWLDFNRFSMIEYDRVESVLRFKSEIDSVEYQFKENAIIKKTDSFFVPLKMKTFYFDGSRVDKGIIDAIKLELDKEHQDKRLFIFKRNDANIFMK